MLRLLPIALALMLPGCNGLLGGGGDDNDSGLFDGGPFGSGQLGRGAPSGCFDATERFCDAWATEPASALRDPPRGENAADSRTCQAYYQAHCGQCGAWDLDRCAQVNPEALTDRGRVLPGEQPIIMGDPQAFGLSDTCYDAYVSACTGLFEGQCSAATVDTCGRFTYDDARGDPRACEGYHAAACRDACLDRYPAEAGSPWCFRRPPEPIAPGCQAAVDEACIGVERPAGCFAATDAFCSDWMAAEGVTAAAADGADPAVVDRRACRQYYGEVCGGCPILDVAACDELSIAQGFLADHDYDPEIFSPGARPLVELEPVQRGICLEAMFGAGGTCETLLQRECGDPTPQQCDNVYLYANDGFGTRSDCFYTRLFTCAQSCVEQVEDEQFDEDYCRGVLVDGERPGGMASPGMTIPGEALCNFLVVEHCQTVADGICRPRFDEPSFAQCVNAQLDPFCRATVDVMCEEEQVRVCELIELNLSNCFDDTIDPDLQTIWANPLCADAKAAQCDGFFADVCPAPSAFACGNREHLHPTCTAALDLQCGADWEDTFCDPVVSLTHDGCSSVPGITETLDGAETACHPWILDQCSALNHAVAEAEADAQGQCFGTVVLRDDAGGYVLEGGQRSTADLFDCVPFIPGGLAEEQADWASDPDVNSCDEFVFQRFYNYEYWLRATDPFISEAGLLYDAAFNSEPAFANFAIGEHAEYRRLDGSPTFVELIDHPAFVHPEVLATLPDRPDVDDLYEVNDAADVGNRDPERNAFTSGVRSNPAFRDALAAYLPGPPGAGRNPGYVAATEAALDDALDGSHTDARIRMTLHHHAYAGHMLRRLQGRADCDDDIDDDCGRADPPGRSLYSDEELAHWYQRRKRFTQLVRLWSETPCDTLQVRGMWSACETRRRSYLDEARGLLIAAHDAGCLTPTNADEVFEGVRYKRIRVCDWAPQDFVDDVKTSLEKAKAVVRRTCERHASFEPRAFVTAWRLTPQTFPSPFGDGSAREVVAEEYAFDPHATTANFEAFLWLRKRHELLIPYRKRMLYVLEQIAMAEETAQAIEDGARAQPLWGQARGDSEDWGRKGRIAAGYRYGLSWYLFQPPGGTLGLENPALCQTNVSATAYLDARAWIDGEGRSIVDTFNEVNAREGRARARLKVGGFGVYTFPEDDRGDFDWTYSDDSDNKDRTADFSQHRDFSLWSFAGLNVFMRVGVVATANFVWDQAGRYAPTPDDCLDGPLELRAHLDVRPSVRGSGFIEAGFDFLVVSVGVGGELDLLEVALPADIDVHIDGNDAYHADVTVDADAAIEFETLSGRLYLKVETFWDEWKKTFVEWSGRTFEDPVPLRSFETYLGAVYDYCRTAEDDACDD